MARRAKKLLVLLGSLASVFLHLMRAGSSKALNAAGLEDWSELCEHVVSVQYEPVVRELQEGLRTWTRKACRFLWPEMSSSF